MCGSVNQQPVVCVRAKQQMGHGLHARNQMMMGAKVSDNIYTKNMHDPTSGVSQLFLDLSPYLPSSLTGSPAPSHAPSLPFVTRSLSLSLSLDQSAMI